MNNNIQQHCIVLHGTWLMCSCCNGQFCPRSRLNIRRIQSSWHRVRHWNSFLIYALRICNPNTILLDVFMNSTNAFIFTFFSTHKSHKLWQAWQPMKHSVASVFVLFVNMLGSFNTFVEILNWVFVDRNNIPSLFSLKYDHKGAVSSKPSFCVESIFKSESICWKNANMVTKVAVQYVLK